MVKLIRNNVLKSGFRLLDGTIVDRSIFEKLLDADKSDE
jgi:hypothetical protein